jgi:hypothetical protein
MADTVRASVITIKALLEEIDSSNALIGKTWSIFEARLSIPPSIYLSIYPSIYLYMDIWMVGWMDG